MQMSGRPGAAGQDNYITIVCIIDSVLNRRVIGVAADDKEPWLVKFNHNMPVGQHYDHICKGLGGIVDGSRPFLDAIIWTGPGS